MGFSSRKEIRDSVLSTTRQDNTQMGSLVNEFINLTLSEINDPAWATPEQAKHHLWSWLRGKTTFATVASTEDYVMKREIDKIAFVRQTSSPAKLVQMPDELFFKYLPNPTASGKPLFYRLWETEGLSTRISTAEKINVVSSSANDDGSAELAVSVTGYSSGLLKTETYQLDGTTSVSGTTTWDAREVYVSKQKNTTGTITLTGNTSGTTLLTLAPNERAPRFKIVTLYPKPSSVITMYVEYYKRIPHLDNDSDAPIFDEKWHYVVRLGAIAKVYQYLNKEQDFLVMQNMFAGAVKSMMASDRTNPDLIERLEPRMLHDDTWITHDRSATIS